MHATLPLLEETDFPTLHRRKLDTLQINLGYVCNQQCLHCHVNAGPRRKETMPEDIINEVIHYLEHSDIKKIDLTGGAPELNPHFRKLVTAARQLGIHVMDRCNLTILCEAGQEDLATFLAQQQVEIVASLPCYLEENVNRQRGNGVFATSIEALRKLNALGYGNKGSGLILNLVYNPQGATLPPPQSSLESDYKKHLAEHYGVVFNDLFTITNMPIKRFGSTLISKKQFTQYMSLLRDAYQEDNLKSVMCRSLISIDWQGYLYDCDFNQILGLNINTKENRPMKIGDIGQIQIEKHPIIVKDHCYGCTAGQGSSCGGALS